MGACNSRDATTPPSQLSSALPPANIREAANKASNELSVPRSSPPSITHPPLPSTLPDSTDESTQSRQRAQTIVSQSHTNQLTHSSSLPPPAQQQQPQPALSAALSPTIEVRAEKEIVWNLHGEKGADMAVLDVVSGEEGELFTAGADKCVVRFDWYRRTVRDRWKAHSMHVERVLYAPTARAVFTACRDSNIRMFAASPPPSSAATTATTSPLPSAAAAAASSSEVVFRGHTLSVSALCFDSLASSSSSSVSAAAVPSVLVSGGRDYSLRWWDIATQQQQQMRILPQNVVTALTATAEPSVLLSANAAGSVLQWDTRTHELVHCYEADNAGSVVSLSPHHSAPLVLVTHSPSALCASPSSPLTAANTSFVRLYDVRMRRLLRQTAIDEPLIAGHMLTQHSTVTVSAGGQVRLWSDGDCVTSARVRGDSGVLRCATMAVAGGASVEGSGDARGSVLLYTGSTDGNVCVWSVGVNGRLAVKTLIRSRVSQ